MYSQTSQSYSRCDENLNEIVTLNKAELFQVMRICSVMEQNLTNARLKLVDLRKKIQDCQKLLNVKNENYTELWPEILENRAIFDLLERAEKTYKAISW